MRFCAPAPAPAGSGMLNTPEFARRPLGYPRAKSNRPAEICNRRGGLCKNAVVVRYSSLRLESQGRLLGAFEGADHVDLVEGTIGGEVDDKRKAKGKHHGEHVA